MTKCQMLECLLLVGTVSFSAVAAIEQDRPSFGPLSPSVWPVAREYLWPEGRMPHDQPQQVAEKTAVVEAKGFDRAAHRNPFVEWYEPAASNKTATCIVVVSGGGFETCCDEARLQPAIDRFVRAGLTVANVTYRTPRPTGLPIHQTAWADVQRAVRVVRASAAKRGFSPDRIGATGISAGAKAVLLVALSSQTPAYERVDEIDDLPCKLAFAMPQAPAYVLTDGATGANARGGEGAEIVPELTFDADTSPLCCLQGGMDVYSPLGSVRLYQRLAQMGVAAELHLFADRWHGFHGDANRGADGTGWDHWCDRMLEFVARFEPQLTLPAVSASPKPLAELVRELETHDLPSVLVSGGDDGAEKAAAVEEWLARRRRGVQSDLHVFSRPIDDGVRAARLVEFLNHSGFPIAKQERGTRLHGPEAWLNMVGGNVRRDGLRSDLESLKATGFSGIHFFHIGRQAEIWPGCEEQIPCLSEKWDDLMAYLGSECERLGLNLTVQNCPGWSQSGGPWIAATNAMRDVEMARLDFTCGETPRLPEVPSQFRDAESDWRDIALLAFPTPLGDETPDVAYRPVDIETNGLDRVFAFERPVTVRTIKLPGLVKYTETYAYHAPWMHVTLEALADDGSARTVLDTDLPSYCWRDYVQTLSLACEEATARRWRYTFRHAYPILTYMPAIDIVPRYPEPTFHKAARLTNWEAMSGRVLRSIMRDDSPRQSPETVVKGASIIDLTDRRRADGSIDWTVPAGRWTLIRVGHYNSKRVNAPAPAEATGWECDKLAPEGIEANFNGYIKRLAEGPLKGKMQGMLVDSWECWCQTWTPRMEQYFREANGYDLRLKLPMLFGWVVDSPEKTSLFLNDWRRTIGGLITKNYYGHMAELAHAAGLKAYYEVAFGDIVCGDLLEYWKYAADPMCEFWEPYAPRGVGHVASEAFKAFKPCVSAAHVYGKRRVVAEAFTEWGLTWMEDFRLLRDSANRAFAKGITHFAYQSCTHAPVPDALPPGGCMNGGNGTPFTRLQTWWKHMPAFNDWVTRCQDRLEAGRPMSDVLWYLGDAADHKPDDYFAFPEGFRADYLNHDVLVNRLTVKDGLFAIPEGTTWRILWVPDTLYMRSATKAKLAQLAAAGGTVVFGGKDALVRALAGLQKDVATVPSLGDEPSDDFMWIHRKDGRVERYFVAAGTNGYCGVVTFRAKGPASLYDPVTQTRMAWQNGTELKLLPSQSVFVEFDSLIAPGASVCRADGNLSSSPSPSTFTFSNPWKLFFTPGWDAPESVTLDRLVPWCDIPGFSSAAKAYSGTVVYETTFESAEINRNAVGGDHRAPRTVTLDLGRVETIAVVYVNGRKVKTLWCEPYACDISQYVRAGTNDLRVEVTGVWRNRVIYDLNQPEKDRKTWILYRPGLNPPLDAPLIPQGLLGPVSIRTDGR